MRISIIIIFIFLIIGKFCLFLNKIYLKIIKNLLSIILIVFFILFWYLCNNISWFDIEFIVFYGFCLFLYFTGRLIQHNEKNFEKKYRDIDYNKYYGFFNENSDKFTNEEINKKKKNIRKILKKQKLI